MSLLKGRLAIVTGAGRGLGAAMAKGLAREGARVIVVDRDQAAVRSVAEDIIAAGGEAWSESLDIADRKAVDDFAARVTRKHEAVHILVNNAGIAPKVALDDEKRMEIWDNVISINLNGQFHITCAFLPALKKQGASIIYTSSTAAFVAPGSSPGYGAAKAGLVSLTKYMARELAPFGIRVNALAPGVMATEMTSQWRQAERGTKFLERVPLRRSGEPDEMAGPAIFLASDMSSYITGITIPVDGGFLAI